MSIYGLFLPAGLPGGEFPRARSQAGFTLLEALIALVVLSLGLLGLAGLQLQGLQGSNDSFARSQAMILADGIADRMRANSWAVSQGQYLLAADNLPNAPGYNCADSFPGNQTTCTPEQMAVVDTASWSDNLRTTSILPAGTGSIVCNDSDATDVMPCSPNSTLTITLMWDEARTGATGIGCTDNPQDRQCLAIELKL